MWELLMPLLLRLGVALFTVVAPNNQTVQLNVPTTYEVSITNRMSGEGQFSVLFIWQESGAVVEEPAGWEDDCFVDPRHQSYLDCIVDIPAWDTGTVPFPVTWTIPGTREFRVVVFAGTPAGPVTNPIFAEQLQITVVDE